MSFRNLLARLLGANAGLGVDVDGECGYPAQVTSEDYQFMYDRGGIGTRVVEVYPEYCWEADPEIYESEDSEVETAFEAAIKALDKQHGLFSVMAQADIDCGIGSYGVILLGINDGRPLSEPAPGFDQPLQQNLDVVGGAQQVVANPNPTGAANKKPKHKLLYMRSFSEKYAMVGPRLNDPTSPRHGMPEYYTINSDDGSPSVGQVHWSRVVHISEKPGLEIYHPPRMKKVYNHLLDLRKNYGGSAQMTWQGGFPGISLEPTPVGEGLEYEIDPEEVRKSMEQYTKHLQRYIAIEGLTAKSLTTQTYDPTASIEVQLKAIALVIGIPYRLFIGTEEAQLAGEQDKSGWDKKVARRQGKVCEPRIVRPTIDRLIDVGILPVPESVTVDSGTQKEDDSTALITNAARYTGDVDDMEYNYTVDWGDREEMSREQRVAMANVETEAMAKYVSGNVSTLIPEREYLTLVLGRTDEEADQILEAAQEAEELLRDEQEEMGLIDENGLPIPPEGFGEEEEDNNSPFPSNDPPVPTPTKKVAKKVAKKKAVKKVPVR